MPAPPKARDKQENQHIQVAVRLRPINSTERKQGSYSVVDANGDKREVTVKERLGVNPTTKTFSFDHVFTQDSKQQQVYKTVVSPIISEVLSGYNCTIFAYGQTGTGKTFTMEGERSDDPNLTWEQDPLTGIIPRSLAHIFDTLQAQECEFSVRVSFLELYNEELFDLLGSSVDPLRLKIYEDSSRKGSVIIQGLEEIVVKSKEEVYEILERGASRRQTAATLMNAFSSRSHSVFTVTIHTKENTIDGEELLKTGKLHLVDLAGSENIGRSGAVDKRAREAGNINQSLLTLGRVITALVEHAPHIPYRESKLTRILQDSLGGRTKTSIIATISPASVNLEETLSTLDYAHRAKNITNRPEINQKLTKKALIKEYNDEIDKLRRDLQAAREKNGFFIAEENYNNMQMKLTAQDDLITELTERIEAMTDELNKVQDLFTETKQELEETAEKLTVTKDRLLKKKSELRETKVTLKITEQDRNEQKFLVSEHVKNETDLFEKATSLLHTAEESTSDVTSLHEKVDRMKSVEQHNKQTIESYEESFNTNVGKMIQEVQSFSTQQQNIHHTFTNHIESKIQRNKSCVGTLTTQMRDLQSCLKEHVGTITQHEKSCAEQQTCWVDSVKSSASNMKDETSGQMEEIKTIIDEKFTGILGQVETFGNSLEQVSVLLQTQMEEQAALLTTWSAQMSSGLQQMEAMYQTHAEAQAKQIEALQTTVTSLKKDYSSRQQVIQDKIAEIMQLQEENNKTISEMETVTVSQTEELKTQAGSMCNKVGEKRKHTDTENQSSLNDFFKIQEKHCRFSQEQINNIKESSVQTHKECGEIKDQITQCAKQTENITTTYSENCAASCSQHATDINTELNLHYKHADTLQSACQTQCDRLVDTLVKHSEASELETTFEKTTVDEQLQGTASFTETQLSELNRHKEEMERYIKQELSECVPTGATPQRREFQIKRNLKRTSDHGTLLDRFRVENMINIEEEIDSDIELDLQHNTESQVQIVVEAAEDVIQDSDDKSDAGSIKSSTSGVSGMSGVSEASKMSECKENDRQGRPLGSKKVKKNFNNVTPRGRTRLPLKQNNTQPVE